MKVYSSVTLNLKIVYLKFSLCLKIRYYTQRCECLNFDLFGKYIITVIDTQTSLLSLVYSIKTMYKDNIIMSDLVSSCS